MSSIAFYKSCLLPIIPPTDCNSPLNFYLRVNNLLSPFYRILGKLRKRRVWPVGAVSNTITSKSIFQIELYQINATLSTERRTLLHLYQELNSLSRSTGFQCLRPFPNRKSQNLMMYSPQLQDQFPKYTVSYHSKELIDTGDRSGILSNFLVKTIAQIMSRVSRNNDSLAASSGYSSGQTTAGCGFTDSTLSTHENPMQGFLINNILECARKLLLHQLNNNTLCDMHIQTYSTIYQQYFSFCINLLTKIYNCSYERIYKAENCSVYLLQIPTFSFNKLDMDTHNMEDRVHKLLILAGDEGIEQEARDYKKLSEVIVNQYLTQNNPAFSNYLAQILLKVIRGIPLKSHFYASLTVSISRQHGDLANRIIESVLSSVQSDLNAGKFNEALNSLNFLSECMNVSFFNSLALMNLLQDVLAAAYRESDLSQRRGLISVLVRALPLCAHSLQEKIYHQFKKFIEKIYKLAEGDDLSEYVHAQFAKNQITEYSAMSRLGEDFENITQLQPKFKLHLEARAQRDNQWRPAESYKWERNDSDEQYKNFKRREGAVNRSIVELLIDSFHPNWGILSLKVLNLIRSKQDPFSVKHLVQSLVLKSLKSRRPIVEYSLLIALKIDQHTNAAKLIEDILLELFQTAQTFEMNLLISYAKLFSFIVNNWKQDFSWQGYIVGQEHFLKRNALLRLILQKLMLLNDKFVCPKILSKYEPSKSCTSEEQFQKTDQLEALEYFENALKNKTEATALLPAITTQRSYQIFLEALLRRTSLSQTHLAVLTERYHATLAHFKDYDWDLINKIRNFFRNSFFHRLLYLKLLINRQVLAFSSYINYVGELKGKNELQMVWIKMQLNELHAEFAKTLKLK